MTPYDELPDLQREILRLLFHTPTLEWGPLRERVHYPDAEVEAALATMIERGYLRQEGGDRYGVEAQLQGQMQAKQDAANAQAGAGTARMKQMLEEEFKRREEEGR